MGFIKPSWIDKLFNKDQNRTFDELQKFGLASEGHYPTHPWDNLVYSCAERTLSQGPKIIKAYGGKGRVPKEQIIKIKDMLMFNGAFYAHNAKDIPEEFIKQTATTQEVVDRFKIAMETANAYSQLAPNSPSAFLPKMLLDTVAIEARTLFGPFGEKLHTILIDRKIIESDAELEMAAAVRERAVRKR